MDKLNIEEIKRRIRSGQIKGGVVGYALLSMQYEGAHELLEFICPRNHKFFMRWNHFKQGSRCPICAGVKKKIIEEIREYAEKFDFICVSKEYKNIETKLEWQCPNGHVFKMSCVAFQKHHKCPICSYEKLSKDRFGPGNPNWKGGISKEPYCQEWTCDLKEYIKFRDNYKCQNPFCKGNCGILCVHHIDYNKKSCIEENLITVGRICNLIANGYREFWEAVYKEVMRRRGCVYE